MRYVLAFCVMVIASSVPGQEPDKKWLSPVEMPKGMEWYAGSKWTQEIAVTNGFDRISKVSRSRTKLEWQISGGMENIVGWKSDKFKYLPEPPKDYVGTIMVLNSFGHYQPNRGLIREYKVGTRFDDVLSYKGKVFEHRTRLLTEEGWKSRVIFKDVEARPNGYTGLKVSQSCASCHHSTQTTGPGSGGYAEGLVPGSNGIFSDPLPGRLVGEKEE